MNAVTPDVGYQPATDDELLDVLGAATEAAPAPHDPDPLRMHDAGNAKRLVERFGHSICYVRKWNTWICFQEGRWMKDESGEIQRMAKDTARGIYDEVKTARLEDQKRLSDHARQSQSRASLDAMVVVAQTEPGVLVSLEELDADPLLLNVKNGTIDLTTGELLEPDPRDLITKQAPVTYDPDAKCPMWDEFLKRIMHTDRDMISFIQRAIGYALTGKCTEQVLFMLYGVGANGKSTLIDTTRRLLGDYATQSDYSTFLTSKGEKSRSDLADLCGPRFVSASEPDAGKRLDEATIKNITGGEPITGRRLYCEPFRFTPEFKLFLSANHRPTVRSNGHALWRRLLLIPFTVVIPREEWIDELKEKLFEEAPGILRWAVEGCLEWQRYGLKPPNAVTVATAEYRDEYDTIGQFLEECCELGEGLSEETTKLFNAYRMWMADRNDMPLNLTLFGSKLGDEKGIPKMAQTGRKGKVRRLGVRLLGQPDLVNPLGETGGQLEAVSLNSLREGGGKESLRKVSPTIPAPSPEGLTLGLAGKDSRSEAGIGENEDRGEAWEPDETQIAVFEGAAL
jgi:phage/plasmid primase, P4 family, C-terminal domain